MPSKKKNIIESLRSAHDPHFKLEGRVEELEKKLPIQLADLHKTLSKSFGMQRKTLIRVLELEKKIAELQAAKEKVEEVVEDIGEDKIEEVVEDIKEEKAPEEETSEEEIPEGLDDVLDDIRGEKEEGGTETKKPAATKKKPKKKPTARKIPKKKPVAKKKKISAEALKKGTVLDDDFRSRVMGEDEEGEYLSPEERKIRFKKSKISADDIRGTKPVDPPPELPAGKDDKETEGLKGIRDVLDDILKVLRLDFKDDRKEARDARKEAARKKRGKREDKLEGVGKAAGGIGKAIKAMVKPFSSIWDIVMNFVKTVILGVLLNKILKWFGNPANQDKIKSLGKFFRDWWPALTTAALLFLTPLGGLVKGVVGLLTAIIPKLVMAIAANPWAAAAVLGGVAIWGVAKMAGGGGKKKEKQEKMDIPEADEGEGITTMSGGGLVPNVVDAPKSAQNFIQKYNQGGLVQHLNEGGKAQTMSDELGHTRGTVTDPKEKARIEAETLFWLNKERTEFLGLPPLDKITLAEGVELTKAMGKEYYGGGVKETSDTQSDFDTMTKTTWKTKSRGAETIFQGSVGQLTEEDKQNYLASNPQARLAQALNQQIEMDNLGADISASAKMNGGGSVKGFNKGGEVPGSGNKDTVPAMLTPGEFVMSKGAVHKYGTDTLENMNAAAGSSKSSGDKEGTVPAMLTPGEFVVSAPAVQQYGVDTMESMNLKGGGNNKPELKEPNVEVNNGGLISNYRNMQSNHYSTGGVVKYFQSGGLVQYLQGGGEVDKPGGWKRWGLGAVDFMTGGLTDFDKRGSMADGAKRMAEKMVPGKPNVQQGENKTITLPTIPKQDQSRTRSNSDVPQFRIPIQSAQRSMVLSSLGIADLIGG